MYRDYKLDPNFIYVTAEDLEEAYLFNYVAADEKYKQKNVRVKGVLRIILRDVEGGGVLALGSVKNPLSVRCNFDPKKKATASRVSKLNPGDNIWVQGTVMGYDSDHNIHISKCAPLFKSNYPTVF